MVIKNQTDADRVWYRYKNGTWSSNMSMTYNGTHWVSQIDLGAFNRSYKLQVIVEYAIWNLTNEVDFTVHIEPREDGETTTPGGNIPGFTLLTVLIMVMAIIMHGLKIKSKCPKKIRYLT